MKQKLNAAHIMNNIVDGVSSPPGGDAKRGRGGEGGAAMVDLAILESSELLVEGPAFCYLAREEK